MEPETVLITVNLLEKIRNYIKRIRERKPDPVVVENVNELNGLVLQMYEFSGGGKRSHL